MASILQNKKILFFTQKFFDYEKIVCKEMERQGAIVHFYDERANVKTIEKIIIKLVPIFIRPKIAKYYSKICSEEKEYHPDYILFITTTIVSKKDIKRMRKVFPDTIFILHLWDSVKNTNAKKIYKLFDRCLSFDYNDCEKYGFIFRPNFFIPGNMQKRHKSDYKYQFSFIGTIHSDRAKIIYELEQIFKQEGYSYYFYFYVQGKIMLFLRFICNRYFRKLDRKNIHLTPLKREDFNVVLDDTLYLIDISHPKQNGLTMRPFDMMYAKRKILTVDKSIMNYDFYRSANQLILDRKSVTFDKTKISTNYIDIPDSILSEYSIEKWLIDLFSLQIGDCNFLNFDKH